MKLDDDIQLVESLLAIAVNLKPKNHKQTKETRKETTDMLQNGCLSIQKRLIGYKCLATAVKLSKDREAITKKAEELVSAKIIAMGGK